MSHLKGYTTPWMSYRRNIQKETHMLSKWLPSHCIDTNCDEVFWTVYQTTHHSQASCNIRSSLLIIPTAPQRMQYPPCILLSPIWTAKTPMLESCTLILAQRLTPLLQRNWETPLTCPEHKHLCLWILDFLTCRPQSVRVGKNISKPHCVLNLLLYALITHDCASRYEGNLIIMFADDLRMNHCTGEKLNTLWAGVARTIWC